MWNQYYYHFDCRKLGSILQKMKGKSEIGQSVYVFIDSLSILKMHGLHLIVYHEYFYYIRFLLSTT